MYTKVIRNQLFVNENHHISSAVACAAEHLLCEPEIQIMRHATQQSISTWRPLIINAGVLGITTLMAVVPAFATDGYLQNGIGARQKALAGAGVASSTDATAASLNPAGLVNVQDQINGSLSVLDLNGGYSSSGVFGINAPGDNGSDPGLIAIPNFAASWRVNWGLADVVAFTAYGNGGVNTRYKDLPNSNCPFNLTGAFCGGQLGVSMHQTFISAAFAKQLAPGLSVGVAPVLAIQSMEVDGVSLFAGASTDPTNFTNRGVDHTWGAGVRGGLEWKAAPGLTFGIAGNTKLSMESLEKYQGLFAQQGAFDIPATIQTGVAFEVRPGVTLLLDYKHVWYSSIASVNNPTTNAAFFGASNGPGFGLQDIDIIKAGIEWRTSPNLTLRAGYSYNTAPLKSTDVDLNILTLGTVQHHITSGLKYSLNANVDLELAAMYAPRATLSGTELGNPFRNVEIYNSEVEVTAGVIYRFGSDKSLSGPLK